MVGHLIGQLGEPGIGPLMDMNMLALTTGRERSLDEYDELFTKAGLKRRATMLTDSPFTILEAVAV